MRGEEEPTLFSMSEDFIADCWNTLGDKRTEGAIVVVAAANCGEATCKNKKSNEMGVISFLIFKELSRYIKASSDITFLVLFEVPVKIAGTSDVAPWHTGKRSGCFTGSYVTWALPTLHKLQGLAGRNETAYVERASQKPWMLTVTTVTNLDHNVQ